MRRASLSLIGVAALAACTHDAPLVSATLWPAADAIFHGDPRWRGADGAYTVDLGSNRTLWLFGDTFIAAAGDSRVMVRNSAAVQTGRDPTRAIMGFYWGTHDDGSPRSLLAEDGSDWFWPGGGARLGGSLVLFYGRTRTPAGDSTGFEGAGWRAVVVDDPDDAPSAWTMHDATAPSDSFDVQLGTAVLVYEGHLYAYGTRGALHDVLLARWAVDDAAHGDLSNPEWWSGGDGWKTHDAANPATVIGAGAPEFSVSVGGRLAPFVLVQSEGYDATTLALRVADAPEGPWSDATSFFRPPESFEDEAFVYAGKAHAELSGADLVATYVPGALYYPRFVRITYP
jgi:hypothetical protein